MDPLRPRGVEAAAVTRHATIARREDWLAETLEQVLDAREREQLRSAIALLDRIAGI